MKTIFLAIFAGSLVAAPLYLLNTFVLPEVNNMQYFYSHMDQNVERVTGISPVTGEAMNQSTNSQYTQSQ